MAITPDEIENHVFSLVRRGYDPAEVDDFLKDVAAALAQARLGVTPPTEEPDMAAAAVGGPDDFERLGEEVAAILRQAHESVATLRHRAEADAALIGQDAENEAALLRGEADSDRQAAAIALEAAQAESTRLLAEAQRQADLAADSAATLARQRTREIIGAARLEAQGAVTVQRNVRDRLEGTREDIDQALDRLLEEDQDLFEAIDLTDATMASVVAGDEEPGPGSAFAPPPGQGPPTPPVPPPTRTTPLDIEDLPYDEDEGDLGEGEDLVELADDEAPPGAMGALPTDVPGDGGTGEAADASSEPDGGGGDDPLAQMVKNAVENALKRRKGDSGPSNGTGA
jgi:DivIVA domain-containing protein